MPTCDSEQTEKGLQAPYLFMTNFIQDEQEMVDDILARGLLSEMGLPTSIITSVFTHSAAAAAGSIKSYDEEEDDYQSQRGRRPKRSLLAKNPLISSFGMIPSLIGAALGGGAGGGGSDGAGILGAAGSTSASESAPKAVIERGGGRDGRKITMYKTLGRAVALAV